MVDYHEIIRETRQRRGMTQAELASMAGVSRHTVVNIEAHIGDIGIAKVEAVLNALGLCLRVVPNPPRPQPRPGGAYAAIAAAALARYNIDIEEREEPDAHAVQAIPDR